MYPCIADTQQTVPSVVSQPMGCPATPIAGVHRNTNPTEEWKSGEEAKKKQVVGKCSKGRGPSGNGLALWGVNVGTIQNGLSGFPSPMLWGRARLSQKAQGLLQGRASLAKRLREDQQLCF